MKLTALWTGALFALGLGVAPEAFADDDLDEVTVEFVFDEVDDVDATPLRLEDEELARDERGDRETDGEGNDRQRDGTDEASEEDRVAALVEDDAREDREEQLEGNLEDHPVEEIPEHDEHGEMDGDDEFDGELEGDGMDGEGEDVASESDLVDEMEDDVIDDEVAETDGEMDDVVDDELA